MIATVNGEIRGVSSKEDKKGRTYFKLSVEQKTTGLPVTTMVFTHKDGRKEGQRFSGEVFINAVKGKDGGVFLNVWEREEKKQ
jgi:hypothetical protein